MYVGTVCAVAYIRTVVCRIDPNKQYPTVSSMHPLSLYITYHSTCLPSIDSVASFMLLLVAPVDSAASL